MNCHASSLIVKRDPLGYGFISLRQGVKHLIAQTFRFPDAMPGFNMRVAIRGGIGNRMQGNFSRRQN